ncbi:hypothetical protein G7Y79_00001g003820 [Physcia stellaris]|nr:hypothetical protein G7Y79_00001g003820 [Physcia stellaris]
MQEIENIEIKGTAQPYGEGETSAIGEGEIVRLAETGDPPQQAVTAPDRQILLASSERAETLRLAKSTQIGQEERQEKGPINRGGYLGRGRPERDFGRGGRSSFGEEREPFRARSRSRERLWEKRPPEDRDYDRSQNHAPLRDDRDREPVRREVVSHRLDPSSSTPVSESFPSSYTVPRPGAPRSSYDARSSITESNTRLPTNLIASSMPSMAKEAERLAPNAGSTEREAVAHRASSPPQAPQVPAFGSIIYQTPTLHHGSTGTASEQHEASNEPISRPHQPSAHLPSAPKVQLPANLPTGPKADQNLGQRSQADIATTNISAIDGKDNFTFNNSRPVEFESRPSRLSESCISKNAFHSITQFRISDINFHFDGFQSIWRSGATEPAIAAEDSNRTPSRAKSIPDKTADTNSCPRGSAKASLDAPRSSTACGAQLELGKAGFNATCPQHAPRGPSMMSSMIDKKADNEEVNSDILDSDGDNSDMDGLPVPRSEVPTSHQIVPALGSKAQTFDQPSQPSEENQVVDHPDREHEDDKRVKLSTSPEPSIDLTSLKRTEGAMIEDEHMDMDEEYLADERKFEQNLRVLESKRPAEPRHHAQLLALLEEIDALAIAAEERANGLAHEILTTENATENPTFAPLITVGAELDDLVPEPTVRKTVIRTTTPPLESLPYLSSGPPTPFSEMEDVQEQNILQDIVDTEIVEELTSRMQLEDLQDIEIKTRFAEECKSWRLSVEAMEDQKRAQNGTLPIPDTPAIPLAQTMPTMEGRRPGRNLSQLDLQRVLKESELSADQEEQKRQREAQSTGHRAKEAFIPPMLKPADAQDLSFVDNTNKIDSNDAFILLGYEPKPDDFSPEEHQLFVEAFLAEPKKFGAIARRVPNRTYQECIQHYYLTKQDGQYKERFNSRAKRGRGKGVGGRGGSGRPKAAPSIWEAKADRSANIRTRFGWRDGGASDHPARRNVSGNKAEVTGETPEKPAGKRSKTGATKEKGVRKSKAPLLAAAPVPSPQKTERENTRGRSKEPKLENEQQLEELKTAELLANLSNTQIGPVPGLQYSLQEQFQPQSKGGPPTSSYWSVPEQTDFNNLIHHFGTNWQAIADHMKTKTQTMVKNYYHRQVERGESKLIEQAALAADEKIKRGEDMGQPPPPTIVPKRRYDTGPQIVPQRQLAPSVDHNELETDSPSLRPTKVLPLSPPQFAQTPQRFGAIMQQEPVGKASVSQSGSHASSAPVGRTTPQTLQQRSSQTLQGPRAGFFSNENARPMLQPQVQQQTVQAPATQQQQTRQQSQQSQQDIRQPRPFTEQPSAQEVQGVSQSQTRARHQDSPQMPSIYQQSLQSQQPAAPIAPTTQNRQPLQGSQIRIAPSQPVDVDIRPRVASHPQLHSQIPRPESHHAEHTSGMRRLESQATTRQPPLQSVVSSRLPQAVSSPHEAHRPSSVPAISATQQPPKRSNIMNILNDEPAEPQPRKKVGEIRPPVPTPPPQSPSNQMYQSNIQPAQPFSRRELTNESNHSVQQQLQRSSMGQMFSQQQGLGQSRDAPSTNWAEVAQRNYPERAQPNYQQQIAESPRMQPSYLQQASRTPLQAIQRSHAPTPPPTSTFVHSRQSSYAGLHSQPQPQTLQPAQQPSQTSTQATQVLQPSPYAQINLHQHIQPQQQHPHSQSSQPHYSSQHLQNVQQQQHRESEALSHQHQYLRQQEAMQQAQQRRQDPFRPVQPDQSRQPDMQQYQSILRPHRDARESSAAMEGMGRREDASKEASRREEALRREDLTARRHTYTPPVYGQGAGFPQPRDRQGRGYDERERR